MRRPFILLVLTAALVACGQPAQIPSTTIPTPIGSPGVAPASSRPQAPQPTATVAVTSVPATPSPLSSTAASPLPTGATVTGTISYPAQPAFLPDAVLTVQLVNQSDCGVFGCTVLSKQIITPVGRGPQPFALAYDSAAIDPQWSYVVDAWISAPGRLDWRVEQPSPVLTQGHPATVAVKLEPPPAIAAVSGTVTYPAQPALPPDAVLAIQLVNIKNIAAPEEALSAISIKAVGPGPTPFTLEYDPTRIDQQETYVVYASLRVNEKLPFVSITPYPVITHGHTNTVDAVLQAPATVTAVSGTITYRAQRPLPPDAKLVIQVKDLGPVNGADYLPILLGEQVITSVGPRPIPFAIEYDPATMTPDRAYELEAKIYAGEQIIFATTTSQRVLADGQPRPIEVMLESVK